MHEIGKFSDIHDRKPSNILAFYFNGNAYNFEN